MDHSLLYTMDHTQTLPDEVLAKILDEWARQLGTEDICKLNTALLKIILVSKHWKETAEGNSRLWSNFSINWESLFPDNILKLWLHRAGARPLSFSITMWGDHNDKKSLNTGRLFDEIVRQDNKRWRRVEVKCQIIEDVHELLPILFKVDASALELESISLHLPALGPEDMGVINGVLSSDSLKDLTWILWNDVNDNGIQHLQVAWSQLTDIKLDTWIPLGTALDVLRKCTALVRLDFEELRLAPDLTLHSKSVDCPPIKLDHLQSLLISQQNPGTGLEELFDLVTCPNLEQFRYTRTDVNEVQWPQSCFNNFLLRSVKLQTLILKLSKS
ncbi:hypothetical protein B0H34DRAFT_698462 [Crassisporium funariophilum]|nr:hypothetical protein B0H34DRAFT_698462 [Crassisporium funariophilum]